MAALKNSITLNTSDFDKNLQQAIAKSEEFQKGLERLGKSNSFSKLGIDMNKFAQDIHGNAAAMSQFATDMSKNTNTVKQQIRQLQNAMANLVANGIDQASESYHKMQMELGRLMDIQSDVQQAGKNFANDELAIQSVTQGFQALTGVIGMGVSAMNLFGIENENTEEVMKKTLQITNLLNGAQAVAQVFNKDSAFMLNVIKPIREAYNAALRKGTVETNLNTASEVVNKTTTEAGTAATVAATVAEVANGTATKANTVFQQAWNVAKAIAKALLGDFSGLLLVGAGALMTYAIATADSTDKQEEQNKALEEAKQRHEDFKNSVADTTAKNVMAYRDLKDEWEKCKPAHERNQFVKDNQSAFNNLKLKINSVTDAEIVFAQNSPKIEQAFFDQAAAAAYAAMAVEEYKSTIKQLQDLDEKVGYGRKYKRDPNKVYRPEQLTEDEKKFATPIVKGWAGGGGSGTYIEGYKFTEQDNKEINDYYAKRWKAEREKIKEEGEKRVKELQRQSKSYAVKAQEGFGSFGGGGNSHNSGGNGHKGNGHNYKGSTETKTETKELGELEQAVKALEEENTKLSNTQQKLTKQKNTETEEFKKNAQQISDNNEKIKEYKKQIEDIKNPPITLDLNTLDGQLKDLKSKMDFAYKKYIEEPLKDKELNLKVYLDAKKAYEDFNDKLKNSTVMIDVTSKADLDGNNLNINNLGLAELNEVGFDVGQKSIEETKNQISETINLINKYRTEINRVNDLKAKGQILSGTETEQFSELETSVSSLTQTLGELIQKYNELISAQNQKNDAIEKLDAVKTTYQGIADTIGGVGNVISQLDVAWAKMTATMLNGISQIIPMLVAEQGAQSSLAISKGVASASGIPYPFNLIAIATTIASILTALATQPFAEGGIVGGTSFKGDKIYARLNSGEMVLNGRQQANLFNMINSGGLIGGGQVTFKIEGRELVGVLNNYNNKRNKVL